MDCGSSVNSVFRALSVLFKSVPHVFTQWSVWNLGVSLPIITVLKVLLYYLASDPYLHSLSVNSGVHKQFYGVTFLKTEEEGKEQVWSAHLEEGLHWMERKIFHSWRLSISSPCWWCCCCYAHTPTHLGRPEDRVVRVWREIPQGFSPLSLSFKSSLFGPWARTRGFLLYLSLLYHNAHFWVSSCAEFKQGGYWREKMVNSQQIGDALNSGSTCNTFSESSNSCSYILFRFHCLVQWKIKGGVCLLANWKPSQHFFLMSRFLKILTRGYSFISFRKRGREKERTSM